MAPILKTFGKLEKSMTMKNIVRNWFRNGLLGAVALSGMVVACTDDHFDVRTGETGTQSLWENIKSNGQLDSLAMILERTRVMKNDYDNTTKQLYSEFLDLPQSFTVWAPKDGTYNAKSYLDKLDEAQALRGAGNLDAALKMEYDVANQFVLNHIARFNYEADKSEQEIHLLNGKVCSYKAGEALFNNVKLDLSAGSINSSNGTMHILTGISPFAYNIYDYIEAHSNYSNLYAVFTDSLFYSREFDENLSTDGALNPDGNMVYVDSVYTTYNKLLTASGASLSDEDSTYVAILPTDEVWEPVVDNLKTYFKYGASYNYDWSSSRGDFSNKGANGLRLNADSLTDVSVKKNLAQSLYFSSSIMPIADTKDSVSIISYALTADSLITTNGVVYYNPNKGGVNPMFEGQAPVKASNGYIFPLNQFNIDPTDFWITRKEYSAISGIALAYVRGATSTAAELVSLTAENRNDTVEGDVPNDMYARFSVSGRSNMQVEFALRDVLSGTYRVSVLMAPSRIDLAYADQEEKCVFYTEMLDDDGKAFSKSEDIEIDQYQVARYVLWDKLTFDKCYYDLPTGYDSFPRLRFNLPYNYQVPTFKKGNCKTLNIIAIVLEPYKD